MNNIRNKDFDNESGKSVIEMIKDKLDLSDNSITQKIFNLFKSNKEDINQVVKDTVANINGNPEERKQSYKEKIDNMTKDQLLSHRPNDIGPNFMTTPIYSEFDQMVVDRRSEILKKERMDKVLGVVRNDLNNVTSPQQKSHFEMYPVSPEKAYFEEDSQPKTKRITLKM